MAKKKVRVYNYSGHSVSHKPENSLAFLRWNIIDGVESAIDIDEEVLIGEMDRSVGFRRMFDDATLVIKDKTIREKYSMGDLDEYILDLTQVEDVVFNQNRDKLEDLLQYAPDTVVETVVEVCMKRELKDRDKLKLIKEYTGKDVEAYYIDMEKEKNGKPIDDEVKTSSTGRKPRQKKA